MIIRIATEEDIPSIHKLAHETWWPAYNHILSCQQISFMLDKMYSFESLSEQFRNQHTFAIAENEFQPIAFASWSCIDIKNALFKMHKLYIHPSQQAKGMGKKLISFVEDEVLKNGARTLELNVNRDNPALLFYKKMGFTICRQEDIPYYQFFMNDYVMQKNLIQES